jgi:hypothetical protein
MINAASCTVAPLHAWVRSLVAPTYATQFLNLGVFLVPYCRHPIIIQIRSSRCTAITGRRNLLFQPLGMIHPSQLCIESRILLLFSIAGIHSHNQILSLMRIPVSINYYPIQICCFLEDFVSLRYWLDVYVEKDYPQLELLPFPSPLSFGREKSSCSCPWRCSGPRGWLTKVMTEYMCSARIKR